MSVSHTSFATGWKMDWNKAGGNCPSCYAYDKPKGGKLRRIQGSSGGFLGCTRFPACKYTTSSFSK